MPRKIEVILPLAIRDTYTYFVPEDMPCPPVGFRVAVPLGKKEAVGIVLRHCREDESLAIAEDKLRPITAALDLTPIVTAEQLQLWQWVSEYYMCPIGDVLAAALPAKALDRQYSLAGKHRVKLMHFPDEIKEKCILNNQQSRAKSEIQQSWQKCMTVLLHGVTSSGKTEVYIHLIEDILRKGKQVLYLVPEIALTTQLTDRLQQVFGNKLLIYHSRVTDGQRMETYRQLLQDDCTSGKVIIGARSAVFLPFRNLGLIIMDEEHEPSYKQQEPNPRYHTRSVAMMIAKTAHAKVLLGTATPSVETQYNAETGKYGLVHMKERFQGLQLPKITLIDLQRQYHRKEMYNHFSDPLVTRIREELEKGKQIILFQNRRGYAPYIQCTQCGRVPKCPQCDVALSYHKNIRHTGLHCHYCGVEIPAETICPECGGEMKWHGFGTERIEDEVQELFPSARIARMDLDSTRKKDAYQQIIQRFSAHEVDILIGTQMVTKGLHFDDVSLVAVLNADSLLYQPSFRSYERTYQMLEQVAGRAGRKGEQGEVIIQTFDPTHPVFGYVCHHDGDSLYQWQKAERQQFCYPPFYHLIHLTLRHRDEQRLSAAASLVQERLRMVFGARCSAVITPGISRIQNLFLRCIQLRIEPTASLQQAKRMLLSNTEEVLAPFKNIQTLWDVDPM